MIQHAEMQSERYLQKLGIKDILKVHGKLQCNKKSYNKIPNEAKKELTQLKTKILEKIRGKLQVRHCSTTAGCRSSNYKAQCRKARSI